MTVTELFNASQTIIADLKAGDITAKYANKKLAELVTSAPKELGLLFKVPTTVELQEFLDVTGYESSSEPEYESSRSCW